MSKEILKWVEPRIELDSISQINLVSKDRELKDDIGDIPLIIIRSYQLGVNDIISLSIDCKFFYPTLYLRFNDNDNRFKSLDFPLNQDVVSIYAKPKSEKHKGIRNDYKILSISGDKIMAISAILKIPNSLDHNSFSLNGTSIESVFKISRNLNLGFASNFENSNDKQNWISFNQTFSDFIKNIQNTAYINNESWIISFIDVFYCMNWLNGNELYSLDSKLDKGILTAFNGLILNKENEKNKEKVDVFILTNHPNFLESDYGISISPYISDESSIEKGHVLNGIGIDLSKGEIKHENFFVNEFFDNEYKKLEKRDSKDLLIEKIKWMGIQSSNVHSYWNTAKGQNSMNDRDFSGINIISNGLTTEIFKGRRIPLFIIDVFDTIDNKLNIEENQKNENIQNSNPQINEFWSGFYVVNSVSYEWNQNGWKTIANLKRKQIKDSRKSHFGSV